MHIVNHTVVFLSFTSQSSPVNKTVPFPLNFDYLRYCRDQNRRLVLWSTDIRNLNAWMQNILSKIRQSFLRPEKISNVSFSVWNILRGHSSKVIWFNSAGLCKFVDVQPLVYSLSSHHCVDCWQVDGLSTWITPNRLTTMYRT